MLGWIYSEGKGTPKDYVKAYAWWDIGSSHKHEETRKNRDSVLEKMSQNQIEAGQKLSEELYEKIYTQTK
jgi:uncharacterized protein